MTDLAAFAASGRRDALSRSRKGLMLNSDPRKRNKVIWRLVECFTDIAVKTW